ncbi:nonhistone protein 6 [Trichosporon asahii var. asahii CBS 8904]|uniref:Nonhistone protein 6 n=1 Tax=Trichosporon asahii var. asahii (strain CBS 8904) TaxID=1220162 RepID=K1VQ73_TRIAC|nr:nonhistone protein 6 [Trichosporon asahii var. asahii CBS 8904]
MAAMASYEEMEAKRQEMMASFKDIANAMTRCVAIIEEYARLSPSALTTSAALAAVEGGAMGAAEVLAAAAMANKKSRKQKEKKPKDPNAPKRPPSAYLLFQNDIREEIRQAHPGMPYKEVLSVIANRWKDLDEPARKDAYNEATTQYRVAEEAYKGGAPATLGAVVSDVVSDDSSSEDDSSDDGAAGTAAKVFPTVATPVLPTTPQSTKKDKKRKSKDESTPADKSGKKKKNKE